MVINFLQQNSITILFKLVIFLILLIQLYQLIVEYVLPALREQIAALHKRWRDLQNKLDLTKDTKEIVQTKIKKQTTSFNDLEKKIQQWHTALIEAQEELEQQQAALTDTLIQKKKQQLAHLSMLQVKKSILPDAVAQAKKILQENCAGLEGKKLLSGVVAKLETYR